MRILVVTVLFLVATAAVSVGAPEASPLGGDEGVASNAPSTRNLTDFRMGWLWYSWGGGARTLDVGDLRYVAPHFGEKVEYEVSPFTLVPVVFTPVGGDDGELHAYYNFRGVVNGLTWGLSSLLGGVRREDNEVASFSPLHYVLFAPDCRVRIRVADKAMLLLGTRSDYSLYRTANTERGILFTPHIGLSLVGGNFGDWDRVGLSFSIGYRSFWNFDGPNRPGEFAFLVSFWGPEGV